MFKRIAAFVLGAVIVFGGFPLISASALTQQEKTALILQLVQKVLEINQKIVALGGAPIAIPPSLATLAQGQGSTDSAGAAACTIERTLALGMRGDDVKCLQTYLISQHLLSPNSATGYFGPLTRTAVIALQTSRGLEPVGFVGKLTRAIVNSANAAPTPALTPALPIPPALQPQPPVLSPPSSGGGGSTHTCTPLPVQTQTLACPAGQTGSITQTRTSACPAGATSPVWGQWQTTANTCAASLPGYDIIIVAGQSNAVGSGLGAFTDPYASPTADARIMQLGRRGTDNMSVVPATWVQGGITYDALQHWALPADRTTMGFAIPFARRYVADGRLAANRTVLIVPAAYGATSILKWLGEISTPATTPNALYDDMLARAKAGLALPGDNRIVAVLWHQGEADVTYASQQPAWYSMSPTLYRQKLTTLMQKIRTDLPSNPPFSIIAGDFVPVWDPSTGLSQALKLQFEEVIRQVLAGDVRGDVATSTGLVTNYPSQTSDSLQWVHFTSSSLVTLGDRYYQAWKQLASSAPSSCTFNGQTVSDGGSVTAFQSSSVAYGAQCVSQQRTCARGVLNGSYAYASCTVNAPARYQAGIYYWGGDVNGVASSSMLAKAKTLADSLGVHVVRLALAPNAGNKYAGCVPDYTLAGVAQDPGFKAFFADPQFTTIILTAYDHASFPDCYTKKYLTSAFFTSANTQAVANEYKDLADVLAQYPDKTFIIQNWEGDNDLYCGSSYAATSINGCGGNTNDKIAGFIAWVNAKTAGVHESTARNVKVGVEFNDFGPLAGRGLPSVLDSVLPKTNADYFSYSSWESLDTPQKLSGDIDALRTKLQGYGKDPYALFVGEVGASKAAQGTDAAATKLQGLLRVLSQKQVPYGIVWELFDRSQSTTYGTFGAFDTSGVLTDYGRAIDLAYSVPGPFSLDAVQGFSGTSYTTGYGYDDGSLVLYGAFPTSGTIIYVNGTALIPSYQSSTQMVASLGNPSIAGSIKGISVPIYVKDTATGRTTSPKIFTLYKHLKLQAVQGFDPLTSAYTTGYGYDDGGLVLYGAFDASSTNTVYVNSVPFVPPYVSATQIVLTLNKALVPGSAAGTSVPVYVTDTGAGTSSASLPFIVRARN